MLYYFARADQMIGHKFTDDVAICKAKSKKEAIQKFSLLYDRVTNEEVKKVKWKKYKTGIVILTDY